MTRRSVLGAVSAASYARLLGANNRIGVGFIGYGLIGAQHVYDFKNQDDVNLVAVAETFEPRLQEGIAVCNAKPGNSAKPYADFRRLLDDKNVEAVVISTPDHWHALMAIMACAAGKDVYVEKPMTLFVREGRWMVDAARKYKRVVQVGMQQRSGTHYQAAKQVVESGTLGKIFSVRMGAYRNIMPGFGRPQGAQPDNFNYDMWLGPVQTSKPYSPHRGIYHFRWFWDFSGGQMTNLGAHDTDIMRWFMHQKGPVAVTSAGGRFCLEDDGETPDTQDTIFEFPGFTSTWTTREAGLGRNPARGTEYIGTKGTLTISRAGFEVTPDPKIDPGNGIPVFQGHPSGGPQHEQQKTEYWTEPKKMAGSSPQQFDSHVRNFLECIRSRQLPIADVEEGHRTATACHLANLSLRTGRKLRWDPEKEEIIGDAETSQMLERPYRAPWDRVLRSLMA